MQTSVIFSTGPVRLRLLPLLERLQVEPREQLVQVLLVAIRFTGMILTIRPSFSPS